MQPNFLDIILIVLGLFYLYAIISKPAFFWERGRIERTRKIIGDKNTTLMYIIIAVILLIVGVLGMSGVF